MANQEDAGVKKPNLQEEYTKQQLIEFRRCMNGFGGALYFLSNYFYIQHPVRGSMLFKPWPYQIELLDVYHNYRKSIAMISRQGGKTTVAAAYLLWYSIFTNDSTILIASKDGESSVDIMERIKYGYEMLPYWLKPGVTKYNIKTISFDNGTKILSRATTPKTGRGLSISLLYLDEYAFVNPRFQSEFWSSISPTLTTGGKCMITTTPSSPDDQFSVLWNGANDNIDHNGNVTSVGKNGFKSYFADWTKIPGRDHAWEREERISLGDEKFEREHNLKFITAEETLVSSFTLSRIKKDSLIEPIVKTGQIRWYSQPKNNHKYCVALDPAMGTGGDYAAIQVFELPTMNQVAEWMDNLTNPENQVNLLKFITESIKETAPKSEIYWSLENNAVGEAPLSTIRQLGEDYVAGDMLTDPVRMRKGERKGYTMTNPIKLKMCSKIKSWLEYGAMTIHSKALHKQLQTYISKQNTYKAKSGYNDDLISSLLIIACMIDFMSNWDDATFNKLHQDLKNTQAEMEDPMPVMIS